MPDIAKHLAFQNNHYRRRKAWYPDDRGLCEAALEVAELAEALRPAPAATGKRPPHFLSTSFLCPKIVKGNQLKVAYRLVVPLWLCKPAPDISEIAEPLCPARHRRQRLPSKAVLRNDQLCAHHKHACANMSSSV